MTTLATDPAVRIQELLAAFRLPTLAEEFVPRLRQAGLESSIATLCEIFELEAGDRRERRTARLLKASHLPLGKTFDTLDDKRLPAPLVQKLRELARGEFLDHAVNVLAFGLPGVGKSHAACALGHALVAGGHSVYFTPAFKLVQEMLAAKRDLALPRLLQKLDLFELVILDDIGYVQQSADEAEVLFTLMSERYERRSLLITSNLVFSEWERIFKSPMTTVAAIDRVVHHSAILEFDVESYRTENAKRRNSTPTEPGAKDRRKR